MRAARTLISLGRCPGWPESSIGAQVILLVLLCTGLYIFLSNLLQWLCFIGCSIKNLKIGFNVISKARTIHYSQISYNICTSRENDNRYSGSFEICLDLDIWDIRFSSYLSILMTTLKVPHCHFWIPHKNMFTQKWSQSMNYYIGVSMVAHFSWKFQYNLCYDLYFIRKSASDFSSGPRQANLVLIAYASSEGSGEPAHPRSLARTFAARSYKQRVKRNLQTESQIPGPSEWLGMRS